MLFRVILKKELDRAMHRWDDYVLYIQIAYNLKIVALTGSKTFSLMFERAENNFESNGRTRKGVK